MGVAEPLGAALSAPIAGLSPKARSSKSTPSGNWIIDRLTVIRNLVTGATTPPPADGLESPPGSAIPDHERNAITNAVTAFANAWGKARTALLSNRISSPEALEDARIAVVRALASSDLGARLPAIQAFMRSSAIELVAALSTAGLSVADLTKLFDHHAKPFEEALREVETVLSKLGAPPPAFWEASI